MQFKVNIGVLRDAIQQASYTLDSKAGSIGSWLYLIAKSKSGKDGTPCLYLYSSNLGTSRTLLRIPIEITSEGETLILPKLLQAILASLPVEEDIELGLSASGSRLQVKYGSIKSEIAVHAESNKAKDVLATIPFNTKPTTTVSAATLVELINRTLFCTATGESAIAEGPWLSSVFMETAEGQVKAYATNRIIAGQAEVLDGLVTTGFTGAIHRSALQALKAILAKRQKEEVTITNVQDTKTSQNEIMFRFSDVLLAVRILATAYPAGVRKVFATPIKGSSVSLNRKDLLLALNRLSPFAEKSIFSLAINGDKATLLAKGYNSVFQEQLKVTGTDNETATIGLGIADVTSALSVMASENVNVKYHEGRNPVHFQEGDSNFVYVLSPVAIVWGNEGGAKK